MLVSTQEMKLLSCLYSKVKLECCPCAGEEKVSECAFGESRERFSCTRICDQVKHVVGAGLGDNTLSRLQLVMSSKLLSGTSLLS